MKKILIFLCFPLIATAAECPLFSISTSEIVPKIDGIIAEAEWNGSVKLRNFMRIGDNRFASEQTSVMIKSANGYLCFAFRFNEYALDKYSNQYKSFKAGLKGKNKPVWEDDCMELRIAPPWIKDQKFFYIAFSAGGATKVIVPKGFNKDVESQLQLSVKENNGFWCAELAIPFAALNAKAEGDWKINLVRFEKRLPENSSYCSLLPGEHSNLGKHAVMRFTENTVLVQEQDYSKLQSFVKLPVVLNGRSWSGVWNSSSSGKITSGKAVSPGKNIIEIPQLETGYSIVTVKIGDFYSSPAYPQSKVSPKVKLNSASEISGTLNGSQFRGKTVTLYPDEGFNELSFTLLPGKAVSILTDTEIGLVLKWKFSAVGVKETSLENGVKFFNNSKQAIKLTAKFLQNGSRFVPPGVDRNNLLLTKNGTYIFFWDILKTKGWNFNKPLDNAEFHLYLPDSVEFLGVENRVKYPEGFPKLNWPADKKFYTAMDMGDKKILGSLFRHWVIKRNEPVQFIYKKDLLHHQFQRERAAIFLRGRKAGEAMAFYHMKGFGGSLGEVPRMIPVKVYPEIKGAKVTDLVFSMMNYWADDLENPELMRLFYNTMISAGVNELVMDTRFAPPPELKLLARIELERINWRNTYPQVDDFIKKHPEAQMINAKGLRQDVLSMSHLLEYPELHNDLFATLAKLKKDYPFIAGLFFDIEEDPFRSRYGGDYSPASLQRFSRKYRITGKLTPEIIKSKYADKWLSFRGSEIGEFSKLIRSMCHKLGLYLAFYTDYDSPKAIQMYTADWQYLNGAVDRAYMGYGRDPRLIENTRKKLPDTPLIFGALTYTNTSNYETCILLQRIIDSKGGVLMWYTCGFGAKEAMALADTTRCYNAHRQYFLSGKRVDKKFAVSGLVPDEIIVYELNGKVFLILLNNTYQTRKLSLNLVDKSGNVLTEFFSGKSYASGKKIELEIPARSAAAFCGVLEMENTNPTVNSELILRNSFETSDAKTSVPIKWRSLKNCFAGVVSTERYTDGKLSLRFTGNGTKNAVLIHHLDKNKILQNPEFTISLDLFVDSLESGMIMPIQLIVVTHENGKYKSNYPGARIFSKTKDGMGSWVKLVKKYDLSKYQNIERIELWIVGWSSGKSKFKGKFFVDNLQISGSK